MIPFEKEASLNETEEYVEGLLRSNWDNVVRSTPGIKEDLEGKFPELSQVISRRIQEDCEAEFSNVFRPGVPDFLAFNDTGEYLFIEVKSSDDGLRSTQLKWLKDFRGLNMEIWFPDSENDVEKIGEKDFSAYTFGDVKKDSSEYEVQKKNGELKIEIPGDLAAITGLSEESTVEWRLKNSDELILDTK